MQITYLGVRALGAQQAHRIVISLRDPNPQQRFLRRGLDESAAFFIDTQTGVILRTERLVTSEQNMDLQVPSILEFSDYRRVSGVLVPFRITETIGHSDVGLYQSITIFNSVVLNSNVSDALFSPVR